MFVIVVALTVLGGATAAPPDEPGHDEAAGGYVSPSALYKIDIGGVHSRITQTATASGYLEFGDVAPDVDANGNVVFSSTMPAPSDGTTDAEIYLLQPDGTLVQLTDNTVTVSDETGLEEPINDLNPEFSPDGTMIAYESPPLDESEPGEAAAPPETSGLAGAQIWVLDLATKATTRITAVKAAVGAAKQPTWNPVGTEIAFTLGDGRRSHIVRMNLDTGTISDVTAEDSHDSYPSWHPTDPVLLAYTHRAGINADVWLKNVSTGSMQALADTVRLAESRPAWSPDGSLIAFQQGDESVGAAVWTMLPDGSDEQAVTVPGLWSDRSPAFADADTLVFESTEGAPPVADLAITMTGASTAPVGTTVTYVIPVVNNGLLTAPDVMVVDTLPAAMRYVNASVVYATPEHGEEPEPGEATISANGNVVTVELGDLARGERGAPGATIAIETIASRTGTYANTAAVTLTAAEGDDIVDPVVENDVATVATTVTPSPSGVTILGTPDDDVITGRAGRDVIAGLGGDDLIRGLGGNDVILGGPGNDRLVGGPGADALRGGDGLDVLLGGDGNDSLFGGARADRLDGGPGADLLWGDAGNDLLIGLAGADRLFGERGNDLFRARDGRRDRISGGLGRDTGACDWKLDITSSIEVHR
ncbi:MAG TPA: hypothetical protein VD769_06640 [Gaiellaceae bacterium]|nr:hypothetical protein [Gaiellaceae bacterium]